VNPAATQKDVAAWFNQVTVTLASNRRVLFRQVSQDWDVYSRSRNGLAKGDLVRTADEEATDTVDPENESVWK
jgi:hypothetical protein